MRFAQGLSNIILRQLSQSHTRAQYRKARVGRRPRKAGVFGTAASCLVSDVPLLQAGRDSNYQCWPGVREPRSASRELPEGALGPSKLSPDMRGFHGAVKQAGSCRRRWQKGCRKDSVLSH